MPEIKPPIKLYKYRPFNTLTIDLLVRDSLYFGDPKTFNDPFDTNPVINADVDTERLREILKKLVSKRLADQREAAFRLLGDERYGKNFKASLHTEIELKRILSDISYNATNPEYEDSGVSEPEKFLLTHEIRQELLSQYQKGILCFSSRGNCPLMWSHYADEHHGICIGYSIPHDFPVEVHPVSYGGSRVINASDIEGMITGDSAKQKIVDKSLLFSKSIDWNYEDEWRMIGPRGLAYSSLKLDDITFGMRCPESVRFAIIKCLEKRSEEIEFYEILQSYTDYSLHKGLIDPGEMMSYFPIDQLSIRRSFADVAILDGPSTDGSDKTPGVTDQAEL